MFIVQLKIYKSITEFLLGVTFPPFTHMYPRSTSCVWSFCIFFQEVYHLYRFPHFLPLYQRIEYVDLTYIYSLNLSFIFIWRIYLYTYIYILPWVQMPIFPNGLEIGKCGVKKKHNKSTEIKMHAWRVMVVKGGFLFHTKSPHIIILRVVWGSVSLVCNV